MRIAKVTGKIVLAPKDAHLPNGKFLICEVLDGQALLGFTKGKGESRKTPMEQSLVVYDELGATEGCLVALSESGEAATPFKPLDVPVDAYCAAILDKLVCPN